MMDSFWGTYSIFSMMKTSEFGAGNNAFSTSVIGLHEVYMQWTVEVTEGHREASRTNLGGESERTALVLPSSLAQRCT